MKIELIHSPPTHFDFMIFWRGLPFFFKFLVLLTYPLAIACMFCDSTLLKLFGNYPSLTLRHFQLWRLLSAPYVSLGMLHYSISILNLYYLLPTLQRTYSTSFLLTDFLTQSLLIQLTFSFTFGVLSDLIPTLPQTYSCSLLSILMIYLVRVCHAEDKEIQVCCLPFKLRSKYLPVFMLIVFNVFTLPVMQFDVVLAYLLGLMQVRLCGGTVLTNSAGCLRFVEDRLVGVFGRRGDIHLLGSSHFGEEERERGSMMASPHEGPTPRTQVFNTNQEKCIDYGTNNSV